MNTLYRKPRLVDEEKVLNQIQQENRGTKELDAYSSALEELFFIENPKLKKGVPEAQSGLVDFLQNNTIKPIWIYFEWNNTLVKTLPEDLYYKLRTARNKNIIEDEEQQNYRNVVVGVAGLSVGSGILSSIVQSGGPKTIKIADFDTIEITNLNRIRACILDIGSSKAYVAAREVWELDPFADLEIWDKGVNRDNIENFIIGNKKIDFFIDEMDDIPLKIFSRFIARKHRIPTLMATDNGDRVILDIERFDLEPEREIFHGLIGNIDLEDTTKLDFKQWLQLATKIVGPEYLPLSMQRSLLNIGKTISSVPQLGTTANIAGSAMSYVIRKIANKEDIPSGRYVIDLEEKIEPEYNSDQKIKKRKEETDYFINNFAK